VPRVEARGTTLQARVVREELRFTMRDGAWHATSRATNLRATFQRDGVVVRSRTGATGSWRVTLRTAAIGRTGSMRPIAYAAPHPGACDEDAFGGAATPGCLQRLEIDRGDGVVELWHNGRRGLEHAFELRRRPPGHGPIVIDVRVEGGLAGRLDRDALVLGAKGRDVLRYAELAATDAAGARLPARMTWDSRTVSLVIDDTGARYPVAVDPLLGTPSWTAEPDQDDAHLGSAVAGAGDVNGDGYADVIVGAPEFDAGEPDEGRVFVFHGSADGLEADAAWTAESDQDATLYGVHFGAAVAAAGDVNGDGYGDIAVGAYNYTNLKDYGEGRVYVYHGSPSGLELAPAWIGEGNQEWAEYGWSVSSAGDVDGDGFDDLVVAARNYSNGESYEGRVYVYRGSSGGLEDVATWNAEPNQLLAHFGMSVASGDFDGDGYGDVVVAEEEGAVGLYVFHGSDQGLEAVASWTANPGGAIWWVADAGDVDADGYDDLIVGGGGGVSLYPGSADGLADEPSWTAQSEEGGINFGHSVDGAGDVNGDGYDDVVIGEYDASDDQLAEGLAFVYHGSDSGLGAAPAWTGQGDQESAAFAFSVAGAGDVDADGYDDVIVGAPYSAAGELGEGIALLYRGSVDDGTPCDGGLWHASECDDSHCFLGGVWVLNGDTDPADPCNVCLVATSQLEWSSVADQTDCPGGLCRAGNCEASCWVDASWLDDGAPNPDNDCETCTVSENPRAWTAAPDGTACADGLCHDGSCSAAECWLGGAWIVNAAANPDNACEICSVAEDPLDWTDAPEGTECEGGLCREGECLDDRCYIDGEWWVDGAADPDDPCRTCDVGESRVRWSTTDGATCGGADGGPGGDGDGDDGGCSCRVARSNDAPSALALALASLLGALVRRRRRGLTPRS